MNCSVLKQTYLDSSQCQLLYYEFNYFEYILFFILVHLLHLTISVTFSLVLKKIKPFVGHNYVATSFGESQKILHKSFLKACL